MVGFPNNYWVFLLKMTILGCFGGTTILGSTHVDVVFWGSSEGVTILQVAYLDFEKNPWLKEICSTKKTINPFLLNEF